jgi:hypothetical protein
MALQTSFAFPDEIVRLATMLLFHLGLTMSVAVCATKRGRSTEVAISALAIPFMRKLTLVIMLESLPGRYLMTLTAV